MERYFVCYLSLAQLWPFFYTKITRPTRMRITLCLQPISLNSPVHMQSISPVQPQAHPFIISICPEYYHMYTKNKCELNFKDVENKCDKSDSITCTYFQHPPSLLLLNKANIFTCRSTHSTVLCLSRRPRHCRLLFTFRTQLKTYQDAQ
ncbi:hypothetical protein Hanom_Chr10g00966781 [Helianthus anomalus]